MDTGTRRETRVRETDLHSNPLANASPPHDSSQPSPSSGASWFLDEGLLLGELKRSRGHAPILAIQGYDDLSELKRGGQGVVYRAVQRSTKRPVAIKLLLDSAYYSHSGRQRFEREVDLAARLRHPGIVRVYDSGLTDDGRAYLVMEFVEGVPLDEFVKQAPHDTARTLRVFTQVCDAVQHAHARGVIHRDLKPSNVRVDADATPRVLDFGLAKLGDAGPVAPSGSTALPLELTTTGQFVGSLPWASPEQAQGDHDTVDTRSDVYSLGVILYQLLTGAFPYDVNAPLHAALNHIISTQPTPARTLRPNLDEQLDVILAKALAKLPADRYQTVNDLADDVRHHLAGEPIRARRESAWRGLQRTARRYRVSGVAGGVTLLALTAGSLLAVRSAQDAARQRDIAQQQSRAAEEQRAAAARENELAQSTVTFLQELLAGASTLGNSGAETKVIDVVNKAATEMDARYATNPRTLATLHSTMGTIYSSLDDMDKGRFHHTRALEIIRTHPDEMPDPLSDLLAEGNIAATYGYEGKFAKAVELMEPIIAQYKQRGVTTNPNLVNAYSVLGVGYRRLGRIDDALRAYNDALAAMPASTAKADVGNRANIINNIASAHHTKGEYALAEQGYVQAIPLFREAYGDDNGQVLTTTSNLAVLYLDTGRFQQALDQLLPLRETAERVWGSSHRSFFITLGNIGTAYEKLGRIDDALAVQEDVIARYERAGKQESPGVLITLQNLAGLYGALKRHDDAIATAQRAWDVAVKIYSPTHETAYASRRSLGLAYSMAGRPADALRVLEPLYQETWQAAPPDAKWPYAAIATTYAFSLAENQRFDEAIATNQAGLDVVLAKFGSASLEHKRLLRQHVKILELAGRAADAADAKQRLDALSPPSADAKSP